jgi:PIN domain nuclease of toxin-antitoxin system
VTVLDAQALIAFLTDEPAKPAVEALIRGEGGASICAVNLAETLDALARVKRVPADVIDRVVRPLIADAVPVIEATEAIAWVAGAARSAYYDRDLCPISLGDAFALAAASVEGAPIATSDPAMLRVATAMDVATVPLPDQWGNVPATE